MIARKDAATLPVRVGVSGSPNIAWSGSLVAQAPPAPVVAAPAAAPAQVPFAIPLIYLYFIGLYIRPQDWFGPVRGLPIDTVVFGLITLCLPLYTNSIRRFFDGHFARLMVAWLAVIVLSNLVHGDTWYARTALNYYARLVLVSMFLLVCLTTPGQVRRVVWFVLILTAVLAVQAIDQVHSGGIGWAGQRLSWNDGFGGRVRWVGLWDGPNVLCLLYVIAFPFLLEFIWGPWSVITRLIALVFSALTFQAILLTQSRGGFLALAVSMLLAALLRFRMGKAIPTLMAAAILLIVIAPGRMGNIDDREGSKSAYNRVEIWSAGLQMLKANPILGVGKTRFIEYSKEITGLRKIAHNSYVENMAETGLIGLFVYISLSFVVFKGLWTLRRRPLPPREASLTRAFITGVCGYALSSMFITTDFDLFYVQLGLASSYLASHNALPSLNGADVLRIGAGACAFVISIYVFIQLFY